MTSKSIHVISFDIPYPPSYGGVIDVYYKIRAMYREGIKVHLHCFEYGREQSAQLNKICASVKYYPRNISKSNLFNNLPYIIVSRSNDQLLKNLQKDKFPVLMEGLHSCAFLNSSLIQGRTIVRTHNVEHHYYKGLAQVESNIFKKYYFYNEAAKLQEFEIFLKHAKLIAAISVNDAKYFASKFDNVIHLPPFHAHDRVSIKPGRGAYACYHGNLAVGENNEAVIFLITKVFNDIRNIPLIIAGSKPSKEVKQLASRRKNIILRTDIHTRDIYELVREAQINILPTFQPTGIKLKLLAGLFSGRHCIANNAMVHNTGLESLCTIADSAEEMKEKIKQLFTQEFTNEQVKQRAEVLMKFYSNQNNIRNFIQQLF